MPMFKVVLQKPVIGKSAGKITEQDLIRNRRVLLVDAPNAKRAETLTWPEHAQGCTNLVSVERVVGVIALAP